MERSRVMTAIASTGGLPQQHPRFDIREPSPPCFSSTQKAVVRDSSYVKPEPNCQPDDSEISIFDAQKYFNDGSTEAKVSSRISPVSGNVINLERISELRDLSPVPRFSSASSSVDGYNRNYRARSFHATPTASSEASWNSQTGLLSNPPGAVAVSMRNPPRSDDKKRGSASKWLLGGRCPCSGKKSVQVEEKISEPRTPLRSTNSPKPSLNLKDQIPNPVADAVEKRLVTPADWLERREVLPASHRISADNSRFPTCLGHHRVSASGRPFGDATNGFTFPILSQTPSPMKVVLNGLPSTTRNPPLEDPPRDSLEVFQPAIDPIPAKSMNDLHRRHSFTAADEDMLSDASSDLFEIESFSTQTTTYQMYNTNRHDSLDDASSFNTRTLGAANVGRTLHCRHSLDEARTPSIAPTECYEPSEASFDWSVTTAEGFDRGSVTNFSVTASEADEMTIMRYQEPEKQSRNGEGSGGKKKGGSGGLLLSCRCEKAVGVGPHPVKCVPSEGKRVGPGSSTLRHVSSRPPMVNKPPLARSHSARFSLPFAT